MIHLVMLQTDVDGLKGEKFAKSVNHPCLIRRKTRMISSASNGECAEQCLAHEDGFHQTGSAGMGARERIVRAQGLLLIKEYINPGESGFAFGTFTRLLTRQIHRRKGQARS